jgi:hypothetical protein
MFSHTEALSRGARVRWCVSRARKMICLMCLFFVSGTTHSSTTKKLLQECWANVDFAVLFHNTTCHEAWLRSIQTDVAVSIDNVESLSVGDVEGFENGAIRLHFEDARLGQYKVLFPTSVT